ncbi:MAG: hypothetical protein L0K67_14275 [Brevibacterium sp.]|nr:hypothetical protein [Brevibacterium sp.]
MMPHGSTHRIGAPFWIETCQPNVSEAAEFYGQLGEWTVGAQARTTMFASTGRRVAGWQGRRVAGSARCRRPSGSGVRQAPASVPPTWLIHVRVDDVD